MKMGIKVYQDMLNLALKEYGEGKIDILAKKMGVHPSYIYKVRKHDVSVNKKFIKGMMSLMNLGFSSLFYYSNDEL